MEKHTYYISMGSGEISRSKSDTTYSFKIEATDDEIIMLREYFDRAHEADVKSFLRSHVPFEEYHNDPQNDAYDENLQQAYRMVYELGDDEAQELIGKMGIIDGM
ncbi:hydrolase [Bacillus sp. 165]|uniref:hydrolase n=1 Tax=Bacillus sp. 165 TaxID=1529117 RepID=UPI001ADD2511|nr:hydrolase [Bacillus sp. 165]MBO9130921.1 hydrolase [Bacillus sp. 165]